MGVGTHRLHVWNRQALTMRIQEILKLLKAHWSGSRRVEDVAGFDPVERALGQRLPADYKYFLMWSNGGESLDPLRHMTFYPLEERSTTKARPGTLTSAGTRRMTGIYRES